MEYNFLMHLDFLYRICFSFDSFPEQANQQMIHHQMMSHQPNSSQQNTSVVSTPTGEYMPQPFQNIEQGMNRYFFERIIMKRF